MGLFINTGFPTTLEIRENLGKEFPFPVSIEFPKLREFGKSNENQGKLGGIDSEGKKGKGFARFAFCLYTYVHLVCGGFLVFTHCEYPCCRTANNNWLS